MKTHQYTARYIHFPELRCLLLPCAAIKQHLGQCIRVSDHSKTISGVTQIAQIPRGEVLTLVLSCDQRHWPVQQPRKEAAMTQGKFLTPEEVSERCRGGISVGTLRNWRAMRIGPTFVKIGKAVLYPVSELDAWDEKNKVTCRAPSRLTQQLGDGA